MNNQKSTFKKRECFKQTYKKGTFHNDKEKIAKLVSDPETWVEIINAGSNDDDTEFVTLKINNIKPQ